MMKLRQHELILMRNIKHGASKWWNCALQIPKRTKSVEFLFEKCRWQLQSRKHGSTFHFRDSLSRSMVCAFRQQSSDSCFKPRLQVNHLSRRTPWKLRRLKNIGLAGKPGKRQQLVQLCLRQIFVTSSHFNEILLYCLRTKNPQFTQ